MRKLLFIIAMVVCVASLHAQKMMTIGNHRYDISQVDSIVFQYVDFPSANTVLMESGDYTIFTAAMELTGLSDSILSYEKDREYHVDNPYYRDGTKLYAPDRCSVGYTLFAEKDEVFKAQGINSLDDLVKKCKEWYGNPVWYDYVQEKSINISTGADYTNRWNVVNMFVAYHILRAKMSANMLVYEKDKSNYNWNYCFGYEPQTYYETMLPNTLVKVWQTNPKTTMDLWLNRYVQNNTLTDQYATFGSDAMHPVVYDGAKIDRDASIQAFNAYVHSIDKVLLYDQHAKDALHERLRFTQNCLFYELASNGFTRISNSEVSSLNGGGAGERIAMPFDFFDDICFYSQPKCFNFNTMGAWRALESTLFQFVGECDFAIKLPHVPAGSYELRTIYAPHTRAGIIEFYIGNSNDKNSMSIVKTLDATANPMEDPSIGWVPIEPYEGEYGIESGKTMHANGYMYTPASFSRGSYNTITDKLTVTDDDPYAACQMMGGFTSCRTESGYGTMMLRSIINTLDIQQSEDYWLRIKVKTTDNISADEIMAMFNFIELVPVDVVNNTTYMEDWY